MLGVDINYEVVLMSTGSDMRDKRNETKIGIEDQDAMPGIVRSLDRVDAHRNNMSMMINVMTDVNLDMSSLGKLSRRSKAAHTEKQSADR